MADIDSERELVTIQSFRELPEAMLAKGMLNSAGIECFLVDDNTGHMLGFISNVIGGIRMKVNKVDAEAAMALLARAANSGGC
jgi:Putative prokaryotic signal transducing protein